MLVSSTCYYLFDGPENILSIYKVWPNVFFEYTYEKKKSILDNR